MKNVIRCYAIRGFRVVVVLEDMQFKFIKDQNRVGTPENTARKREHVKNRVISQTNRGTGKITLCYTSFQCTIQNDGGAPYDNSCVLKQCFRIDGWSVQVSFSSSDCRENRSGLPFSF